MQSLGVEIETLCRKFGLDLQRQGSRFVCNCPFHPESRPSFTVYTETNSFYCFSCQAGGDPLKLANLLDPDIKLWSQLVKWYRDSGSEITRVPFKITPSLGRIQELLDFESRVVTLPDFPLSEDSFLASFGVRYAKEGGLKGRHVIPIHLNGALVAFEARDFNSKLNPKTLILPPLVNIHSYLWNIDNIESKKQVTVVEGIKGALAVIGFGFPSVVSSFGARLTSEQVSLLLSKTPTEIIVAYDADEAGELGALAAVSQLLAWFKVSKVALPKGKDPWDVTKKTWTACYKMREELSTTSKNEEVLNMWSSLLGANV